MKKCFFRFLMIFSALLVLSCTATDFVDIALDSNYGSDNEIKDEVRERYLKDLEKDMNRQ